MTSPVFTKEDLVSVYAALVEVVESDGGSGVEEVSEVAEMDEKCTELVLDELAHMGFVELQNGSWDPNLPLDGED